MLRIGSGKGTRPPDTQPGALPPHLVDGFAA